MDANELYQRAWQRLLKEIQKKTGWGNIELQKLMLDCLVNPEKAKILDLEAMIEIMKAERRKYEEARS